MSTTDGIGSAGISADGTDSVDGGRGPSEFAGTADLTAGLDDELRAAIARAAEVRDPGPLVDELLDRVVAAVHPDLLCVFSVDEGDAVQVHKVRSLSDTAPALDFSWAVSLFAQGRGDRAATAPTADGRTQMVVAMDAGDGRLGCLMIEGEFDEPAEAESTILEILRQARDVLVMVWSAAREAADEATVRERTKLSRELHDSLSQSLWSLSMLSETAQQLIDPADPAYDVVRRISDTSLRSQAQMRQLLIDLRADGPPESMVEALERRAENFARSSGVAVTVLAADAEVAPRVAAVVVRVAEEALNNVERHASATSVRVEFDCDPDPVLVIDDDGVGFACDAAPGHLGVQIMKERAAEIGLDVQLSSVPGSGTTVVMAGDVERHAAIARRRRSSSPPSSWGPVRWATLAAALSVAAVVSAVLALAQNDRAVESRTAVSQAEIMEARIDIGRAVIDEVSIDMVAAFGFVDPAEAEAASVERAETIERASAVAARYAGEPDPVGTLARQTQELGSDVDIDGIGDLLVGYDVAYALFETVPLSIDEARPMAPALTLGSLEQVALLGLHEGLIARWASDPAALPVSDDAVELFEMMTASIELSGGYFGADSEQPFRGGYLPTATVEADDAEGLSQLTEIVVAEGLWADDAWVRSWSIDGPPAPSSAEDHIERAFRARDQMRDVVDGRLDLLVDTYESDRDRAADLRSLWAILGLAALAGAVWCVLRSRRSHVVRGHTVDVDRSKDPLTGVFSRKALDERTREHLVETNLVHHVVVTLDMDRFKAVNDVHGHPFGDRVLAFIGEGLSRLAEEFEGDSERSKGVAIRLGGDEFFLSLHSPDPIAADGVRRSLERLRSAVLSAPDGSLVRAEFSYGLVEAVGAPDLVSLMTASDLAAYEDKDRQKA